MISPPQFIGFDNYKTMFSGDPLFWQAIWVTSYFTLLFVPLQIGLAFFAALLLNTKIKGMKFFRTLFYLPTLLPVIVNTALWMWLYNTQFGLFNMVLGWLGLPPVKWLTTTEMVIPSLVFMALWGIGNVIIIFLAGLQGVSKELLEAVEIDGGGVWHRFCNVIVPIMSPIIFYNVVIGIINSLQNFTQAYIMTQGGPINSSLFYILHLYRQAFTFSNMGYGCALAWIFFVGTLFISGCIFKSSKHWVFYESEGKS